MHDLTLFRGDLDQMRERLASRGFALDVSRFQEMDIRRRAAITEAETLRAARKSETNEIGQTTTTTYDLGTGALLNVSRQVA